MELGALICTPKRPKCLLCPLQAACQARAAGDAESLPARPPRKARPRLQLFAGLARDAEGRIWFGRRPEEGLLGGLWSLPSVLADPPGPTALAALDLRAVGEAAVIEHGFTHQHWTLHTWRAEGTPRGGPFTEWRAVPEAELSTIALAGPTLKALHALGVAAPTRRGAGRARTSR